MFVNLTLKAVSVDSSCLIGGANSGLLPCHRRLKAWDQGLNAIDRHKDRGSPEGQARPPVVPRFSPWSAQGPFVFRAGAVFCRAAMSHTQVAKGASPP